MKKKRLMVWWRLTGINVERYKFARAIWIHFLFIVVRVDYSKQKEATP